MIRAYCDRCGAEIPAEFAAGVRVTLGKGEVSFHLCEKHMTLLSATVEGFLEQGTWRVVK